MKALITSVILCLKYNSKAMNSDCHPLSEYHDSYLAGELAFELRDVALWL